MQAKDGRGQTPLHYAVRMADEAVLSILLRSKPALGCYDNDGNQAIHLATENGFQAIVEMLARAGADVNARMLG